jgi:hypothetical protein
MDHLAEVVRPGADENRVRGAQEENAVFVVVALRQIGSPPLDGRLDAHVHKALFVLLTTSRLVRHAPECTDRVWRLRAPPPAARVRVQLR